VQQVQGKRDFSFLESGWDGGHFVPGSFAEVGQQKPLAKEPKSCTERWRWEDGCACCWETETEDEVEDEHEDE